MNVTFTITATLPDNKATEILEKITDYLKYQVEIDGQPNRQTRKQYLEIYLKKHLQDIYESIRATEGGEVGRLNAIAKAKEDIK